MIARTARYTALLAATIAPLSAAKWYEEMQIGPAWSNSFTDTYQGQARTAALKGILIDLGGDHRALFDTETLRMVAVYPGFINWGGTPWTGDHGKLVTLKDETPIAITASGSGWADAA